MLQSSFNYLISHKMHAGVHVYSGDRMSHGVRYTQRLHLSTVSHSYYVFTQHIYHKTVTPNLRETTSTKRCICMRSIHITY